MLKFKLGEILRDERMKQGLSLREFSDKLNISHAYLNKLEKGTNPKTGKELTPTMDVLIKIAKGLDIPQKEFLELCGYLDSNCEPEQPVEHVRSSIDLDEFRQGLLNQFSNADEVIHDGRRLSSYETSILVNALLMSIDLVTRKETVLGK